MLATVVTLSDMSRALANLGLSGRAVCVHSSLRSLGAGSIDAAGVVEAFLRQRCTVLVPTFSWNFATPPPPGRRPTRNGCDYDHFHKASGETARTYEPELADVDADMGVIARTILGTPGHFRSGHPLCSFAAVGQLAGDLIPRGRNMDLCAPLNNLCDADGSVLLIGVDLSSMTLIHVAEKLAGRSLFRRWARADEGIVEVEVGGCSNGFTNLEPALQRHARRVAVGSSGFTAFIAQEALNVASAAIQVDPSITHCGDSSCGRCNDAVSGGPKF
jgi:aminoglycoside 3-N-acetyltransferase